jgi:hypothetical protein
LLIKIAELTGVSQNLLHFGAIPYRPGQSMVIAGDNSKFRKYFNIKDEALVGLTKGFINTIEYHKKRV